MQFGVSLQKVQHATPGEDSLNPPVRINGQLVDVLPPHCLQGRQGRSVRRNRVEPLDRAHYPLHTGLRPEFASDLLYFMGRDEANDPVASDYHIATMSTMQ